MQMTVTTIIFGLPEGQRRVHTQLTVPPTLTVRELIRYKVEQEVADYLAHVRPGISGEYRSAEVLIKARPPEALVPEAVAVEMVHAQQAFAARDYMIVVDDQRIMDADTVVTLSPQTRVEFIKILPLVGG